MSANELTSSYHLLDGLVQRKVVEERPGLVGAVNMGNLESAGCNLPSSSPIGNQTEQNNLQSWRGSCTSPTPRYAKPY
jgi:hypothetical protein